MSLPTSPATPPAAQFTEDTGRFVEACQRLKTTDPEGWAMFFGAFAMLALNEFKKSLHEPGSAVDRATAQGRAQFADVLSTRMENCSEDARAYRDIQDRKKRVVAEQQRSKGTLLGS